MTIWLHNLSLMQVLDALLSEYEKSIQGPGKWQRVAVFLQQRFVDCSCVSLGVLFVIIFS